MGLDVNVKIDIAKPIGTVGPWFPLFYVVDSTAGEDSYGEYTSLAQLVAAGYTDTTDVYKAVKLMLEQNAIPAKFAVLKQKAFAVETFAKYLTKGWRQVVPVGTVADGLSAYIETTDKMLFITISSKDAATYKADRTFVVYHPTEANAAAAVVGATAGYAAGSFTYKNIIINGVEPVDVVDMPDTELETLHSKGAITILEKAGDVVTSEGITSNGEYADIIDSQDAITQDIAYSVQKVFNNNKKVAYTNAGIALLEAAVTSALVRAANNDMIATNENGEPMYSVNFSLREATTESERAERKYPYGQFALSLAGAIHNADIVGEITI